jgi:uncharacterized membrane protein YbhN (UPF0104 family)
MSDYWFKPHAYGYGTTPANWKGWAAVAGYAAVVLALVLSVLAVPPDLPEGPWAWQIVTLAVMVAALTVGFIWLCRQKRNGQWAWRWGRQR